MPESPRIQFRSGEVWPALEERAGQTTAQSEHEVARRDLLRYYQLLQDEARRLPLDEAEWNALRDALNGTILDERTYRYFWADVEDALPDGLAAKWGLPDGDGFLAKLRALSPGQAMAVVDAVERWWRRQGSSPLRATP